MPVPSAGPVINDLRDRHPYRVLPLALGTCLGDVNGWTWAAPSTWRVQSSFRLASFWIRRSGRWGIAIAVFIDPDIVAQAIAVGINANQRCGRRLHKHGGLVGMLDTICEEGYVATLAWSRRYETNEPNRHGLFTCATGL